ncbi:MAG: DNA polymerase III subunit beta [Lentisphaerae bacterium GWF2_52_8]|nr:MAG: DNA polymerase III subunit beta [Lentisphaerae bacterium GWF2_52_8]
MKLSVHKENFLKALQKVSYIIGSRSTLPVLANVLLEAQGGKLTLTTTDLEVRITTKMEANVEREGKTTLPAKKLLFFISNFEGETVTLDCNENHHTELKCGTDKFVLVGLATEDFPLPVEFETVRKMKFQEAEFGRILDQISYAVSLDDTRKVLHGILCSIKDSTFTAVATDGKRLALVEKMIDGASGGDGDVIIPLKSATELGRLLGKSGDLSISFGEKQACFETSSAIMTTKLIEGNYPNYRQVIPVSFSKKVLLPVSQVRSKLKLVSGVLTDQTSFIKLTFKSGKLIFEASSTSVPMGEAPIDIEYADEEMCISFNPVFLGNPFEKADSEKMALKMNDSYSPVAIEGNDGFLYVIMPMRK